MLSFSGMNETKQSCMCDTVVDACKRCCRYHLNDTCFPIEPFDILPDGTPCVHGFCNSVRSLLLSRCCDLLRVVSFLPSFPDDSGKHEKQIQK